MSQTNPPGGTRPPLFPRLKEGFTRFRRLWEHEIWLNVSGRDRSLRGRAFAVLRVVSITLSGLREIKVAVRAAALSYSSLLSLGPLIALTVLVSGFAIGDRDPAVIAESLNRVISFIAPQVGHYDAPGSRQPAIREARPERPPPARGAAGARPETPAPGEGRSAPGAADGKSGQPAAPVATGGTGSAQPALVALISDFITSSRSGTAGAIGLVTLLFIVLSLFSTIENTFNDIWGVRRGRTWLTRIVYYWTVMTLGALTFFMSVTLLSAGAFLNVFNGLFEWLPLGQQLREFFMWLLPSASGLLLVLLLTIFYRTIPNTRVRWRAAFAGAAVVTLLLFLNNYLAFLYFRQIISTKSLYGSVALPLVLMLGLYVFWLIVLVGGQLTYAIQNVRYRSSQTAWHSLNAATRESLSLLVLLLIARRFKECLPPYSATELAQRIRVPAQVLNESLNRLCDVGLAALMPSADIGDPSDYRYQPARPLNRITLVDFHELFVQYGEAPSGGMLNDVDPILAHYHEKFGAALRAAVGGRTLEQLIDDFAPSATTAPFAIPGRS
ncbi:MAG TPA: YhjD/YihY/BrkB family envelope integrity protein [Opitutaceae bacterium]|nr:YhjD/YihY/BrkB family envelope integrity protein [Opitutaceae bacterium]